MSIPRVIQSLALHPTRINVQLCGQEQPRGATSKRLTVPNGRACVHACVVCVRLRLRLRVCMRACSRK